MYSSCCELVSGVSEKKRQFLLSETGRKRAKKEDVSSNSEKDCLQSEEKEKLIEEKHRGREKKERDIFGKVK